MRLKLARFYREPAIVDLATGREGSQLRLWVSLFPVNAFAFDRASLASEVNFDRQHFPAFGEAPAALAFDRIDAFGCFELRLFNNIHAAAVSRPVRGAG